MPAINREPFVTYYVVLCIAVTCPKAQGAVSRYGGAFVACDYTQRFCLRHAAQPFRSDRNPACRRERQWRQKLDEMASNDNLHWVDISVRGQGRRVITQTPSSAASKTSVQFSGQLSPLYLDTQPPTRKNKAARVPRRGWTIVVPTYEPTEVRK